MGIKFGAIDNDDMPLPHDEDRHEPNCATGNQALIVRVLGFTPDERGDDYGVCSANEFYERVTLALSLLDDVLDDGVEPWTVGDRWHECGRRPGYVIAKLHELREHALWCAAHGYRVQWA